VWLANINCEKLEALFAIMLIKFIEGRDLAHERRSSDTTEFKQYMFLVSIARKTHALTRESC
jgi:hypothetical protein